MRRTNPVQILKNWFHKYIWDYDHKEPQQALPPVVEKHREPTYEDIKRQKLWDEFIRRTADLDGWKVVETDCSTN